MISETVHTPARSIGSAALAFFSILNALVVAAALVAGYFANIPTWESWTVIMLIIVLVDVGAYSWLLRDNELADTLSFRFTVLDEDRAAGAAAYKDLVKRTERYLAQNRLTAVASAAGPRWPGAPGARSTAFALGGTGLTLNVMRRKGRSVVFAIGPVADGADKVARKVIEGLRRELIDEGENDQFGETA